MADNFHYIGGRCMVMRLVRDDDMVEKMHTDLDGERPIEQEDGPVQELADDSASGGDEEQVDPGTLEALLFSTHHPLTAGKLGELLDCSSTRPIRRGIKSLKEPYEQSGRGCGVEQVAGGYQLLTLPKFNDQVNKLHQKEGDAKLTKAALETL